MGFRFSLAVLLRVRQSLERQQEILLHEASQRVAAVQREVAAVENALKDLAARNEGELKSGMSAAELHFDLLRRSVLRARGKQLQQDMAAAEKTRAGRQEEFQQARRQREAVETLRHNQLQLYLQQEKRKEQNRLDDLFLLRREFLRRR
jgi:flagellar export protein FliJ